jgi:hypothetical protein
MSRKLILLLILGFIALGNTGAQSPLGELPGGRDTILVDSLSTGWAPQATTLGYITAPSVIGLMFVSALINEWNAGYAGIPASAMILAVPPLIYAGGRSVGISKSVFQSRAKLGWTLYALSIIPTSMALYGFTTDWGATLPLTIASGVLGSASIVAMTVYTSSRANFVQELKEEGAASLQLGICPLAGGAMATLVYRF